MWKKKLLDGLLASCVASDPMVYMYWLTARREADEQREAAMAEEASVSRAAFIRPIELARRSRKVTA